MSHTTNTSKASETDSLRRDDLCASNAFAGHDYDTRVALKRAATRGAANLPRDIGVGWIMVPTKKGVRQVAFDGLRAWVF